MNSLVGAWLSFLTLAGTPTYLYYKESMTQGQFDEFMQVETACLATNVYHEARNQGLAGQLAVAGVTINRVNDDRFPDTICGVVREGPHQPSWKDKTVLIPVKNRCQFSWYCDGKSDVIQNEKVYNEIYSLMEQIVSGNIDFIDITGGATHYHADYVRPAWARTKTKTIEIDDHIFYRWER